MIDSTAANTVYGTFKVMLVYDVVKWKTWFTAFVKDQENIKAINLYFTNYYI